MLTGTFISAVVLLDTVYWRESKFPQKKRLLVLVALHWNLLVESSGQLLWSSLMIWPMMRERMRKVFILFGRTVWFRMTKWVYTVCQYISHFNSFSWKWQKKKLSLNWYSTKYLMLARRCQLKTRKCGNFPSAKILSIIFYSFDGYFIDPGYSFICY